MEDPGAHHAENKGRPGVVAEGQQALRLGFAALPAPIQGDSCSRAHGIAPHKAQGQGGGTGPIHPEQRDHKSLEQLPQIAGQAQLHHKGGEDKEGEQRGDDNVAAQPQSIPGGGHCLLRPEEQGRSGQKKPGAQ